ncbi:ubiquinol-cytochrome c reductase iron-sulfur subunit [Halorarius halobius]|uniref:ubiquinol-cytochrome c reductase iron-sulfur subunit n=1 Tax=Halorarius halobius TaxID=2962671 RepID=UPI0020CEFC5D|nr:ubiquinol-cytochrome c reductase iron-sulfur subunit [Halorarius halobius]
MDDDKYPPETGRRRFVKGVVGSASLAGVGTAASTALTAATSKPGTTGGPTTYVGIRNTDGPAPRGMPLVPLTVDDDGYLKGIWPEPQDVELQSGETVTVAREEMGELTYSGRWFQYCGVQQAKGVQPTVEQDNYLRAAPGTFDWQDEMELGQKLHVDDFDDYETWGNGVGEAGLGKPAQATWRSQSGEDEDVTPLPVQVVRSTRVPELPAESQYTEFLNAATERGFIAWLDKCTHFCCVPEFKAEGSAKFGAQNQVYCQCHQSVYDPFSPTKRSFTALPRD